MFIAYQKQGGIEYARLMTSVREGDKIKKIPGDNLGRVLDRERGIYMSRKNGVFTYDLKTQSFGKVPADFVPNVRRKNAKEKLIVDFGDVFLMDALIEKYGLSSALDTVSYRNPDSFRALLLYYILERRSNAHAETWLEGSWARIKYPKANLSSQRISDILESVGDEENLRAFFRAYIPTLGVEIREGSNILIDSTGLPNSIHFPLTAVSNHNGQISEEVRLIYVVQEQSRLPLYMRYVPGNVIDASTLITTIKELKALGVNTKFALLDAGYATDEGLRHLLDNHISFLTRCPTNRILYRQALEKGIQDLELPENLVLDEHGRVFNGRQVYVKLVEVEHHGVKLYAFIGRDKSVQEQERRRIIKEGSAHRVDREKFHEEIDRSGIFVLLSSRRIRADKVLEHYYIRQEIEQVFDISKNYASLLPLNVQKESTFRGHLLMTFIATVILKKLQEEIRNSPFSIDRILMQMRTQKAKVYENTVLPAEPVRGHNEIYRLLGVKPAKEYPRPCTYPA